MVIVSFSTIHLTAAMQHTLKLQKHCVIHNKLYPRKKLVDETQLIYEAEESLRLVAFEWYTLIYDAGCGKNCVNNLICICLPLVFVSTTAANMFFV